MQEFHRYKNILRFFVITAFILVPITVFAGFLAYRQLKIAETEIGLDAERLARIIANQETQRLEDIRNFLIGITQFAEFRNQDIAGCNKTLELLLTKINVPVPTYYNIAIADRNGDVFCSALPPGQQVVNVADRYYFKRALRTRTFSIGEYQIGRITKKQSLNFGYPIINEKGEVTYVAIAALNLEAFHADSDFIVTDRQGTILAYPGEPARIGTAFSFDFNQEVHDAATGFFKSKGPDGQSYIFGFAALPSEPREDHLHIIVGVSEARALTAINKSLAKNIVWFVISTIIAFFLGWLLSGKLLERLLSHR
ncbi:MAG TPA: hypothetical protein VNK70_01645 [Candidatus Paceibacterota bacterium]|nr:hypothetical protein [Candidatus Paceibacterota bacterium]